MKLKGIKYINFSSAITPYYDHPELYSILIYISSNDQLSQSIRLQALNLIGSLGVIGVNNDELLRYYYVIIV